MSLKAAASPDALHPAQQVCVALAKGPLLSALNDVLDWDDVLLLTGHVGAGELQLESTQRGQRGQRGQVVWAARGMACERARGRLSAGRRPTIAVSRRSVLALRVPRERTASPGGVWPPDLGLMRRPLHFGLKGRTRRICYPATTGSVRSAREKRGPTRHDVTSPAGRPDREGVLGPIEQVRG